MQSTRGGSLGVSGSRRGGALGLLIASMVAAGGCSADVSRFDSPFFGVAESTSTAPKRPAAGLGRPGSLTEQSPDQGSASGGAYFPPSNTTGTRTQMSSLPDPAAPATVAPVARTKPVSQAAAPAQPRQQASVQAGQTIDVQPGDTLYGISRRYQVSLGELQSLNGGATIIKPGQKLVLPASARAAVPRAPSQVAIAPAATPAVTAVAPGQPPVADANGMYVVRAGDQIGSIAKANKTSSAELLAANGLTDPKQLRAGVTLRMPNAESPAGAAVAAAAPAPAVVAAPVETAAPLAGRPKILNDPKQRVASLGNAGGIATPTSATPTKTAPLTTAPETPTVAPIVTGTSAVAVAATGQPKFRWPVQGKVHSGFGPRADGSSNDGLDILVPVGTEVLAAEAGEVVYTGDGIPSFGNLVLLRHANGYVTAYAHNDQLLVKRGDKVRRGQPVAKAGKSGQVDQPTLHFEVRQGQTPVDPMPFMEKL
jgi:murein DD-endopeptidase MepM/ murein hydrolase activator NlpD